MKSYQYVSRRVQWRFFILVIAVGLMVGVSSAEAALAPRAISGVVQVLSAGEQSWKAMTSAEMLKAGDQVQSAPDSSAEFWFEDGSMFWLGPNSKLVINEFQVSQDSQSRVVRVKLMWGTVTGKITKLEFTNSVCEIETDSVVVGLKFSEATVKKAKDGMLPDQVIVRQGLVDIRQIAAGTVGISARVDGEEGLDFSTDALGARINIKVQNLLRKVTLTSDTPLTNISSLIGQSDNFLKLSNEGDTAVEVTAGNNVAILQQQAEASLGIPSMRGLSIQLTKGTLTFQKRKNPGEVFIVFNNKGEVSLNGEAIKPDAFKSAVLDGEGEAATTRVLKEDTTRTFSQDQEEPVEPPSNDEGSSGEGGTSIVPTSTPQLTPTPETTPTPEATSTPRPTRTPTPTPKPRPTRTPKPTVTPIPTATPTPTSKPTIPPKPTQKPPSPIKP